MHHDVNIIWENHKALEYEIHTMDNGMVEPSLTVNGRTVTVHRLVNFACERDCPVSLVKVR